MPVRSAISKLVNNQHHSIEESLAAMTEIMEGNATDAQIASFITALRMKGETVEEITGCTLALRKSAVKIKTGNDMLIDTCGTGGDARNTFNISTASAFVVAGAGLKVAKHGNRAFSSQCGSADVLMRLGINIEASVKTVEKCLAGQGPEGAVHLREADHAGSACRRLVVILVRTSNYDDEGYVVRHWRGTLPSNTLSCLHSLTEDVVRSGELGAVDVRVEVIDEIVSRVDPAALGWRHRRDGTKVVVGLVGVQTNQFPRAQDLARQFKAQGFDVIIGGFHVSGAIAMSPTTPPECQDTLDAGVTLVLGEVEGRWGAILPSITFPSQRRVVFREKGRASPAGNSRRSNFGDRNGWARKPFAATSPCGMESGS